MKHKIMCSCGKLAINCKEASKGIKDMMEAEQTHKCNHCEYKKLLDKTILTLKELEEHNNEVWNIINKRILFK